MSRLSFYVISVVSLLVWAQPASADVPDPYTYRGHWVGASSVPVPLTQFAIAGTGAGKAVLIGGEDGGGSLQTNVQIFDATLNAWSTGSALSAGRAAATALTLGDGRVLVAGGQLVPGTSTGTAVLYDPTSDSWATAASMYVARTRPRMVLLDNGLVLVVGASDLGVLSSEVYNPGDNTWSLPQSVPGSVRDDSSNLVLLPDGRVTFFGNMAGAIDTVVYAPGADSWSMGSSLPFGSPGGVSGGLATTGSYSGTVFAIDNLPQSSPYGGQYHRQELLSAYAWNPSLSWSGPWGGPNSPSTIQAGSMIPLGGALFSPSADYVLGSDNIGAVQPFDFFESVHTSVNLLGPLRAVSVDSRRLVAIASDGGASVFHHDFSPTNLFETSYPNQYNNESFTASSAFSFGWSISPGLAAGMTGFLFSYDDLNGRQTVSYPANATSAATPQGAIDYFSQYHYLNWTVAATYEDGNYRYADTGSVTLDTQAPTVQLDLPQYVLLGSVIRLPGSGADTTTCWNCTGAIAVYEYDLDNNGTFEASYTPAEMNRADESGPHLSFPTLGFHSVSLRAVDFAGNVSSPVTDTVEVTLPAPPGPLGVTINNAAIYTNSPHVAISAVWPLYEGHVVISNDGGFANAQTIPVANSIPWTLNSSGTERLPKTVYVRFGSSTQTYTDDIILDETAPIEDPRIVGSVATSQAAKSGRTAKLDRAVKRRKLTIAIRGKDSNSGVAYFQITTSKGAPGVWLRYTAKTKITVKKGKVVYLRVRDRAGNVSKWRTARKK